MINIGITARVKDDAKTSEVKKAYIDALNTLDDLKIWEISKENFTSTIVKCDGILLTGGDDYDPSLYHEKDTFSKNINKENDELDYEVISYASEHLIPLLGICRGIQGINIFFGGSLFQDIKHHMKEPHKISKRHDSDYLGINQKEFFVNSYHHQAINKLGQNLRILYQAKDGIIEAIEHTTKPIYGVQFHPEIDYKASIASRIILSNFLDLVHTFSGK